MMRATLDRRLKLIAAISLGLAACAGPSSTAPPARAVPMTAAESSDVANPLQPVSAFAKIPNRSARSAALFVEAGRVIQHPRCLNCHPANRVPTQGEDLHVHMPPIHGGEGDHDHGVPGLQCNTCHQAANVLTQLRPIATIPGNPRWGLAPASMAWQGKTLNEICVQIKDTARNGGMTLEKLHEHMAEDPLVGWAWHPGEGRVPAPGTQEQFGQLLTAWIETGAVCPGS